MSIAGVFNEGRLIRNEWASTDKAGRQLLCLYTAMLNDPEARPSACPSAVCPEWLAHLLPWMDDNGTAEAWPGMVSRVARLAPHFARVRPQVEWQVRAACVREAMRHTTSSSVLAVCEAVAVLCDRRGRNETVSEEEMKSARAAARAAAWAAAWAAAVAAAGAAEAAAGAAEAAARASRSARVERVSTDRLTTAILDLIEADLREQGVAVTPAE